eukprot:scaffold79110_cov31-Attheya_sp.AAC.1
MAYLKSVPLTFTGIPRLPEATVHSCETSQEVVLGDVDGKLLRSTLGDIEKEGTILGTRDGITLVLGNILGALVGSNETDGPELGPDDGSILT